MNTPQPPTPPNAGNIIQASQIANNTNQQGPWGGGLNYAQGPNGQWTATTTANPTAAGIVNTQLQNFQNENGPADPSQAINKAIGMENQYMSPFFQQQQSQLNSQLQNQGFSPSDAAAQLQQRNLQNQQSDWVGGNVAQFEPLAYQQSQQSYFDPLQAASGTAQAFSPNNNFVNTPQVDVNGAYNTQQQGAEYNYGQQMQNRAAMLGGLFSIPSAALGGWARNGFGVGGGSGGIGNMPATGAGSPNDFQSNLYALSQGINPFA